MLFGCEAQFCEYLVGLLLPLAISNTKCVEIISLRLAGIQSHENSVIGSLALRNYTAKGDTNIWNRMLKLWMRNYEGVILGEIN